MPSPLLLADVPWLLYRAYFSLPRSIVGADGRPVNALLGTVNAILAVCETGVMRGVVACMGAEQAVYRVTLYPRYHAHREEMPAELARQWQQVGALMEGLGWTFCSSAELEADDVMFSFAREEEEHGGRALLMTGDRDLYGAVSDCVAVTELAKGGGYREIGPPQVRERYGVEPHQVPDLIALRGDPSDGLPGAPGVGQKTATQLLQAHGSLEAVLASAAAGGVRPRIAAALLENAELLRAFKRIATLQRIDVRRPPDRPTDLAAGAQAARELGMERLATRLERAAAEATG